MPGPCPAPIQYSRDFQSSGFYCNCVPLRHCGGALCPSLRCSLMWCWKGCCPLTLDGAGKVWLTGWLARSCASRPRGSGDCGWASGARRRRRRIPVFRGQIGTAAGCERQSSWRPWERRGIPGISGLSPAFALPCTSTWGRCLEKWTDSIIDTLNTPFGACLNKEGLTETVLVFWVTVTFSWRGFDDQLHRLDLVLTTNGTPRHRATVFGGLWQFDVALKGEVRQQGQHGDVYASAERQPPMADVTHLIVDRVVHPLVRLDPSDPFVHHKWRLQHTGELVKNFNWRTEPQTRTTSQIPLSCAASLRQHGWRWRWRLWCRWRPLRLRRVRRTFSTCSPGKERVAGETTALRKHTIVANFATAESSVGSAAVYKPTAQPRGRRAASAVKAQLEDVKSEIVSHAIYTHAQICTTDMLPSWIHVWWIPGG